MKSLKKILLLLFSVPTFALAAEPSVWIDVPLYDYPFNNSTDNGPDYFSMRQSMALTNSYLQTVHLMIGGKEGERNGVFWRYTLITAYDYFMAAVPIGNGWAHEEWHRSVLTNRGISSFNDMNKFPWGEEIIAVSHVSDDDLIALKRDHPADMVRLSAAGMEAQVYQNKQIEMSHFYRNAKSRDTALLWLNSLNVASYMLSCNSEDANSKTDDEMAKEGSSITKRDFTGLDCTAWVYDLHRPTEAYTARGTHPSGVGIKRYIKYSDLNDKEKDYLDLQTKLSYLNFINPFLIGLEEFETRGVKWNFNLSHYLTAFGGSVDTNLFFKTGDNKFFTALHLGMTENRYFPGLTLKWIDIELGRLLVTLSGTAWQQPKDLNFYSDDSTILLDASLEVAYRISQGWQYYVGFEHKNEGWLAGNVYLDKNDSVWTGIRAGIF